MEAGAGVGLANSEGWTSLLIATEAGREPIVRCLLENCAAVDQADVDKFTPLFIAAQHGHLDVVECLLDNGATIDLGNAEGHTALHVAAPQGHLGVIASLLGRGMFVDHLSTNGATPLIVAVMSGCVRAVRFLIDRGANPDHAMVNGLTALVCVAMADTENVEMVGCLLDCGASIDLAGPNGVTALLQAALRGHNATVKCLIDHNAAVDQPNMQGLTPLMAAAQDGFRAIVICLIHGGAAVNNATSDGWSPLLLAARRKHVGIVRCLLDRGASIEQPNNMGFTALCVAAKHNSLGVAKLLVKRKANIDPPTKVQWLQQRAWSRRCRPRLFPQCTPRTYPVACTDSFRYAECDFVLLRCCEQQLGFTPVVIAAQMSHTEMLRFLLQAGADHSLRMRDQHIALAIAEAAGNEVCAQLLSAAEGAAAVAATQEEAKQTQTPAKKSKSKRKRKACKKKGTQLKAQAAKATAAGGAEETREAGTANATRLLDQQLRAVPAVSSANAESATPQQHAAVAVPATPVEGKADEPLSAQPRLERSATAGAQSRPDPATQIHPAQATTSAATPTSLRSGQPPTLAALPVPAGALADVPQPGAPIYKPTARAGEAKQETSREAKPTQPQAEPDKQRRSEHQQEKAGTWSGAATAPECFGGLPAARRVLRRLVAGRASRLGRGAGRQRALEPWRHHRHHAADGGECTAWRRTHVGVAPIHTGFPYRSARCARAGTSRAPLLTSHLRTPRRCHLAAGFRVSPRLTSLKSW